MGVRRFSARAARCAKQAGREIAAWDEAAFLAAALVRPSLLAPLNRVWFKFGLQQQRVVNPLVMVLIYFARVQTVHRETNPRYWKLSKPRQAARSS